ncbi:MAG: hypothetical protein ACTSRS_09705 [Candidatus Helarchaeota archaeon]
MAEEEQFDLRLPPGIPNLEEILSDVLKKFEVKLIAPKNLDQLYYMALRGKLKDVQAAKEYIRKRLEEMVTKMEKK